MFSERLEYSAGIVAWLLLLACPGSLPAEQPAFRIYIDADRTGCREAGLSIERGVRLALDEVDSEVAGRRIELVIRDHRGNSRRSTRHLQEFLRDDRALAVVAGVHSTPLLANLELINENAILVLDPWAPAGPITRFSGDENWVFRLSVDDARAGRFLARRAFSRGFRHPHLLLEKTGWGESCLHAMGAAALELFGETPGVTWFNWGLQEYSAKAILRKIKKSDADVIFLVANAPEAKPIARGMLRLPREDRLPILGHLGITANDFAEFLGPVVAELDLRFIQTRSSFLRDPLPELAASVLERATKSFDGIDEPRDIQAPTGFVHAYDLTRILLAAIRQASQRSTLPDALDDEIEAERRAVRDALEHLETPVPGLLKTYEHPFRPFRPGDLDAHEALSPDDYTCARYIEDGTIILDE